MVGVDAFDQHVFKHTISRKVAKWPIRIIESCITFALANARAAFCVENKIDFTKYSLKKFYLEILRLHYPKIYKISKISLDFKVKSLKYTRCIWKNCSKKSKTFCDNKNCRKLACKDHMMTLCCKCFSNNPTDISTRPDNIKHPSRICKIFDFCKVESRILCASESCRSYACANHRNPICLDCSLMHLSSVSSNYSEKVIPKKNFV